MSAELRLLEVRGDPHVCAVTSCTIGLPRRDVLTRRWSSSRRRRRCGATIFVYERSSDARSYAAFAVVTCACADLARARAWAMNVDTSPACVARADASLTRLDACVTFVASVALRARAPSRFACATASAVSDWSHLRLRDRLRLEELQRTIVIDLRLVIRRARRANRRVGLRDLLARRRRCGVRGRERRVRDRLAAVRVRLRGARVRVCRFGRGVRGFEVGLRLLEARARRFVVELGEEIAGLHLLVLDEVDLLHGRRELRGHRDDLRVDLRVVRRLAAVRVHPIPTTTERRSEHEDADPDRAPRAFEPRRALRLRLVLRHPRNRLLHGHDCALHLGNGLLPCNLSPVIDLATFSCH